jgi:hypothetical protein
MSAPVDHPTYSEAAEVSQADPPFIDKSLVRSFSSFEKPHHRPGSFPSDPPVFQQKPGTRLFFFRKTSSLARASHEPTCLV